MAGVTGKKGGRAQTLRGGWQRGRGCVAVFWSWAGPRSERRAGSKTAQSRSRPPACPASREPSAVRGPRRWPPSAAPGWRARPPAPGTPRAAVSGGLAGPCARGSAAERGHGAFCDGTHGRCRCFGTPPRVPRAQAAGTGRVRSGAGAQAGGRRKPAPLLAPTGSSARSVTVCARTVGPPEKGGDRDEDGDAPGRPCTGERLAWARGQDGSTR